MKKERDYAKSAQIKTYIVAALACASLVMAAIFIRNNRLNTSNTELNSVESSSAAESSTASEVVYNYTVGKLKKEYGYKNNILSPIYNVKENAILHMTWDANNISDSAFDVYTDSSCSSESKIDTVKFTEVREDGSTVMEIQPPWGIRNGEPSQFWGSEPMYYIRVSNINTEVYPDMSSPVIIPFRICSDVEIPTLSYKISDNGIFKLSWQKLSNVDGYRIYRLDSSADAVPVLAIELDAFETEWYDWSNNGTNGLGAVNNEATIYENFGLGGRYYMTAIKGEKESRPSNIVDTSTVASVIPVRVADTTLLNPGEFITDVKDLPRSVGVTTLNGDIIKYSIDYSIDESTRYSDNVFYNYDINGTELHGYVEIKAANVTNLPVNVNNGVETYEDSYDFDFSIIRSTSDLVEDIDVAAWIDQVDELVKKADNSEIQKDNLDSEYDSCEHDYLSNCLYGLASEIDLSAFPKYQNATTLQDDLTALIYQDPLIMGVSSLEYNEDTKKLSISYTQDDWIIKEDQRILRDKLNEYVSSISEAGTNLDKVNVIYTFISNNFIYKSGNGIYSMISSGSGDAVAYSQLFKAMCDKLSVPCVVVSGTFNGVNHLWNAVQIDGKWLYIDCTNNLRNIGMRRICYLMSSTYAKQLGYSSDSKFALDDTLDEYKCDSSDYEWYTVNNISASTYDEYLALVKSWVESNGTSLTVRYTGEKEIKATEIVNGITQIYKDAGREIDLGTLNFGDGLGYYVLWHTHTRVEASSNAESTQGGSVEQ